MKLLHLVLAASLSLCTALCVGAYEFQPLGFESIGMGGAGVANASGPMAGYYNPALLTESRHPVEFNLGAGFGGREHNLAENIDKLSSFNTLEALERIAANNGNAANNSQDDIDNVKTAKDILQSMSGGNNSLSLMPAIALGVQMKRLGIGFFVTSEATAKAMIDGERLALIVTDGDRYWEYDPTAPDGGSYTASNSTDYEAQSLQYSLENKTTYLRLTGLALNEVPISYAMNIGIPTGKLSVGASAKLMQGMVYERDIDIDTESGDLSDSFDDDRTTSSTFGVDLGLLYQPEALKAMRLGLVAKNLNTPKFKTQTAADYAVEPMYRAGLNYGFFNHKLDFAVDYDLRENKTASGAGSQYLGGGVNFHPNSWFSLRGGAMQNLANSDEGTVLTGGFGIGLKWVSVDLSAQMSTKKGYYDGKEIPRYLKANFSLVSRW